jgi:hypothetical protein
MIYENKGELIEFNNKKYSGYSTSINSNGSIVAIGSIFGLTNLDSNSGVCIFEYKKFTSEMIGQYTYNTTEAPQIILTPGTDAPIVDEYYWTQLGFVIAGEGNNNYSGHNIELSDDGLTIAIGADGADGADSNAGHVRVYSFKEFTSDMVGKYNYTNTTQGTGSSPIIITNGVVPSVGSFYWTQLGYDLDNELSDDKLGRVVSLNGSGTRVVISGEEQNSGSGYVRVYEYKEYTIDMSGNYNYTDTSQTPGSDLVIVSGGAIPSIGEYYWTQIGEDINGSSGNKLGYGASLNDDGNFLVIGAPGGDYVKIYNYDGSNWTQFGNTLTSTSGDFFGSSVAINSLGNIIAISAEKYNNNQKKTDIYKYNNSNNTWEQYGYTIKGPTNTTLLASNGSLDIDGTGEKVVIGYPSLDIVRIYEYKQFTADMVGNYNYTNTDYTTSPIIISNNTAPTIGEYYWTQIDGDKTTTLGQYGYNVNISKDGNSIINGNYSANGGYAEVYAIMNIDTDGDGVFDNNDAFPTDPSETQDTDGDGVGDSADAFPTNPSETQDTDGDGVGDSADAFPTNPSETRDTDGDGVGDSADAFPTNPSETQDTDGDGVGDSADAFPTNPSETQDTDGDGVGDSADAFPNDAGETQDTDGDGIGDSADAFPNDRDNDGVTDDQDAFPTNPSETQDTDGDGVGDSADVFPNNPSETQDTDGDGVGDSADAFPNDAGETQDTDGDGVGDSADAFPNDASETQDTDGDGVGDSVDVFPTNPSETQDTDGDGVGDSADAFPNDASETQDTDGDGVGDSADAFPNDASETQDTDGDGVGDSADAFPNDASETQDTDGDGVGDSADAFPNDAGETQDTDGDGIGDSADAFPNDVTETVDADGDGVGDNADAFPNDPTESKDTDDDGVGDNAQALQIASTSVLTITYPDTTDLSSVMTNIVTSVSAELLAIQPIVKIAEEQKTVMKKLIEKEYNVISLPKTEIFVDVASFKGTDAPIKTIINVPTDLIDPVTNKLINPITTVTKIVDEDLNFDGYSINILKTTNGTDISLIITNTGIGERTLIIEPTAAQYEYILTDSDNDTIKYQMNVTIGSLLVTLKNFSTPKEFYAFIKSAAYQTKKTRSTTYNSNAQAKSMTQIRRGGVTLSQQEMNKTGKHTFGASSVVLKRKLAAIGKANL